VSGAARYVVFGRKPFEGEVPKVQDTKTESPPAKKVKLEMNVNTKSEYGQGNC
jgi:hypothetical protein